MCVIVCPNSTYAHEGECIDTCFVTGASPQYYIDKTTLKCVEDCPDYYFKDDGTG